MIDTKFEPRQKITSKILQNGVLTILKIRI